MKAEDIKKVVVLGAGTMGEGIAQNFAISWFIRLGDCPT